MKTSRRGSFDSTQTQLNAGVAGSRGGSFGIPWWWPARGACLRKLREDNVP
jgi:hypothetical protein